MKLLFFTISLILSYELILFTKLSQKLREQIGLYKILINNIGNENIFFDTSKKILNISVKILILFFLSIIPIILFILYLFYINYNIYLFILSSYYMTISIILFILYLILRSKFVKRKL